MKTAVRHPQINPHSHPDVRRLAELVGELIEFWGFKAVQGRMWCYLYLSGESLSSKELAQLLDVSPALVTQSVQVLLQYRVIFEDTKGLNGILRFSANPDAVQAIMGVLEQREVKLLERLGAAAGKIGRTPERSLVKVDEERVRKVREWIGTAQNLLALVMGSMRRDL